MFYGTEWNPPEGQSTPVVWIPTEEGEAGHFVAWLTDNMPENQLFALSPGSHHVVPYFELSIDVSWHGYVQGIWVGLLDRGKPIHHLLGTDSGRFQDFPGLVLPMGGFSKTVSTSGLVLRAKAHLLPFWQWLR